jgi:hypothetical protein
MTRSAGDASGGDDAQPRARQRRAYRYDAAQPPRPAEAEQARVMRLTPASVPSAPARVEDLVHAEDEARDALGGNPGSGRLFRHDAA